MFRPMIFLTIIKLDTIIGENYTRRNMACIDLHIKPSAHTPANFFVNEISSPYTYTNTDGYTVSYYTG